MKLFFLLVFFNINLCAFAQFKPIYFQGDLIVKDSTLATSYGIYGKLSGEDLYILKTFDLENNLKFTGSYKDDSLKIAHGTFTYYEDVRLFNDINGTNFFLKEKNRFIAGKGVYENGYQSGRWIRFYPDGKIMNVVTFAKGIKHGFYGIYAKNGKPTVTGSYNLGEKDGEWIYGNGRLKEIYINGKLQPAPNKKEKSKLN